jgi:hypothetical protein
VNDEAPLTEPLRWQRGRQPRLALWTVDLPGDLGEDGGIAVVRRTERAGRCVVCGRGGSSWVAEVGALPPFPAVGPFGPGCTRSHAARRVPRSWSEVAAVFAAAAAYMRSNDPLTEWHERLAALRAGQAERATWLSRQQRPARQLALRLWTQDDGLDVTATDAVVAAVLSERTMVKQSGRRRWGHHLTLRAPAGSGDSVVPSGERQM